MFKRKRRTREERSRENKRRGKRTRKKEKKKRRERTMKRKIVSRRAMGRMGVLFHMIAWDLNTVVVLVVQTKTWTVWSGSRTLLYSFLHEYGETATSDQLMEDQESLSHAALIDQVQLTGSQLEIWSALASSSLMVAECDLTHEHRLRLEHTVDLDSVAYPNVVLLNFRCI